MQWINRHKNLRLLSVLLVGLVLVVHVFSIHAFLEDLVVCYESGGQVQLEQHAPESTVPLRHADAFLAQDNHPGAHSDLTVDQLCRDETPVVLSTIHKFFTHTEAGLSRAVGEMTFNTSYGLTSFLPPAIEYLPTLARQTVVLLN